MIKKVLSASICAFTVLFTSVPVFAEENLVEESVECATEDLGGVEETAEYIEEELGCEVISEDEVPYGIEPIEFDTVEEAKEYIEEIEKELSEMPDVIEANEDIPVEGSRLQRRAASNVGVKSASCDYSLGEFTIYAQYTYSNNKFTGVKGVSSTISGLMPETRKWTQDSYGYSITNNGKQLNVSVYGHFDNYFLINNTVTHYETVNKTFYASWDWM